MRALGAIRTNVSKLASLIATTRQGSGFVCGEGERWQRCGLLPSDKCILRAARIASNGGRSSKRTILHQW
jgi:hypothetical protein